MRPIINGSMVASSPKPGLRSGNLGNLGHRATLLAQIANVLSVARQHYLPAALIGRFSNERTLPARARRVYVARADKVFPAKAERIGYVQDLYELDPIGPAAPNVDERLNGYEASLPEALDLLEQFAAVPLKVWLRTLVPWVTSVFVRGADFIPRYSERLGTQGATLDLSPADNANLMRLIEFQRLLAPVMTARWTVMNRTSGEPFVINDLGLTLTGDPSTGAWGWALPLSRSSILTITPRLSRTVAHYRSGSWWAVIERGPLTDPDGTRTFNTIAAKAASDFIAAADITVAQRLVSEVASPPAPSQITELWPFDSWTVRHHELEWHRLAGATSANPAPEDIGDLQNLTFDGLDKGWVPGLVLGANIREMPTGLTHVGNVIRLTMTTLTNYDDFVINPGDADA